MSYHIVKDNEAKKFGIYKVRDLQRKESTMDVVGRISH